ncbi:hypothetical protein ANCDUO_18213, partial [Ancylostoma duodenale]
CDECVHHLVADVDRFGFDVDRLNMSIGNISSATVVGARLSRNSKNVATYNTYGFQEMAELLSGDEYNNFVGDAKATLSNMSLLFNSADRTSAVAGEDVERAMNLTDEAGVVLQDIRRRAADASAAVDLAKNLVTSLGSHSSALVIDPMWMKDAEETLHNLEVNDKIADYLSDAQHLLKESRKNSEDSRRGIQAASGLSTARLEGLIKALADGRDKALDEHRIVSETLLEVKNLTEQAKDSREAIGNSMANIAEIRAELAEATEPKGEKRNKRAAPFDKAAINAKVAELEAEANRLNETFGSTRLESQNAVEAATAYSNLTDSLKNAHEKAQWTIDEVAKLGEGLQENKDKVKALLNESAVLLRQSSNLQQSTLNTLKKEAADTEKRIEKLSTTVEGMRRTLDGMRTSLKSPLNESTFADVEKSADHVNSLLVDSAKVRSVDLLIQT